MPKPFFNNNHSKKIEEIIRVNHAGEFGAQKIYQGQIRYCKNPEDQKILKIMLDQEQKHLEYFSHKIQKGYSRPTIFMPLWNIGGYLLGAISAKINLKAAMIVTENVEAVIEDHYAKQIDYLETYDSKNSMLDNIKKFQADETEHKDIAITHIQDNSNMLDNLIGNCIKTICRSAIFLSKKL
ncbi:MAG: demethoxyubiquinone hydroxylase family protein [Rickettsiaceae bacterium]|jgi:ubiquinone biosynthesis monooxygenase Coq7|nr:demethoxyubiquinone hydroxylase family protein [Rickettsiaceae bacterium]